MLGFVLTPCLSHDRVFLVAINTVMNNKVYFTLTTSGSVEIHSHRQNQLKKCEHFTTMDSRVYCVDFIVSKLPYFPALGFSDAIEYLIH